MSANNNASGLIRTAVREEIKGYARAIVSIVILSGMLSLCLAFLVAKPSSTRIHSGTPPVTSSAHDSTLKEFDGHLSARLIGFLNAVMSLDHMANSETQLAAFSMLHHRAEHNWAIPNDERLASDEAAQDALPLIEAFYFYRNEITGAAEPIWVIEKHLAALARQVADSAETDHHLANITLFVERWVEHYSNLSDEHADRDSALATSQRMKNIILARFDSSRVGL